METTTTPKISTLDAIWALYQAQSKRVKRILRKRILEEEREEEEKAFQKYVSSATFLTHVRKVRQKYQDGEGVTLKTPDEIENYLDSL